MKQIIQVLLFSLIASSIIGQSNYPFKVDKIGNGQPLILIPGLACSGEVWDETVNELSKNYECHVLTLAGFAAQQPLPEADSTFLPLIKAGVIQYIKDKNLDKPILMGHSLGGFLSLWIASSEPELLQKIIIVDSYPFYSAMMNSVMTVETAKAQAIMMKNMTKGTTDDLFLMQQKQMMPTMIEDSVKIAKAIQWSLDSDRNTIAQAMYELMTTDLRTETGKVNCPILVLGSWYAGKNYGITAQSVFDNYSEQFKLAEHCTIKVAQTARHFIMYDEPEWFIQTVKQFLR